MGEEVKIDDGVPEWEAGLPSADDLMPLSQALIPAELASAFKISPEAPRSMLDVNRASDTTLSSLRAGFNFKPFNNDDKDHTMAESDEPEEGSDPKKTPRVDAADTFTDDAENEAAKTLKRPRLVWTPQLHKRFVEVVAYLGLKNAVPKTIMQLMNVEGLTRENVASHLQKYRLYVKRMQGLSNEGPSPSDHLFASTPVPRHSFNESSSNGNGNYSEKNENNHVGMSIPMPYLPPPIVPMPIMGMAASSASGYNGYESAHSYQHHFQQQYNNMVHQERDWSGNNLKLMK
ncbi:transcription factor PCL1-like [Primulina tabacum]|uniref:transcription factor PCL1-like n=1 Tax=Primulina tabacum TaxID=48773 RepID=UPI003F593E45